jgi:precorrin-8X/cobalt-precorrin-8 methylmutase
MIQDPVQPGPPTRPLVYGLYENPLSGDAIEARSMETIDLEARNHDFSPDRWEVVRRMIHTTADFGLIDSVRFSENAIRSGIEALRAGSKVFVDSNMIRAGLSLARLRQVCPRYGPDDLLCHVADADVAAEANKNSLPRSLFAVRKAKASLHGGIAVFGNAPVALMELNRLVMEEGLKPALIVAMPVGFVHVVESKEELMSLDVPYIAIAGRRGGSPLAVSTIHALCSLATRSWKRNQDMG